MVTTLWVSRATVRETMEWVILYVFLLRTKINPVSETFVILGTMNEVQNPEIWKEWKYLRKKLIRTWRDESAPMGVQDSIISTYTASISWVSGPVLFFYFTVTCFSRQLDSVLRKLWREARAGNGCVVWVQSECVRVRANRVTLQ
jgi:hypothetical protein